MDSDIPNKYQDRDNLKPSCGTLETSHFDGYSDDSESNGEYDNEEAEFIGESEEQINDSEEDECSDKEGANIGQETEEPKSKGIVDHFNDYLETIFSTYEEYDEEVEEELTAMYILLWRILSGTIGVIGIIIILVKYPQYLHTLHENQLWFSNIKEVEREISFRTEQGLYYSYYKQILEAPTWHEGINELIHDNRTEHGRTINILHRFNVLPEIVLSGLYKWLKPHDPPILFYVSSVFKLHGVYLAALFMTSWYLSNSCLGGIVTSIFFVIHRIDTTRVNYTIPLRESFAIPLLFMQLLLKCTILRSDRCQKLKLFGVFLLSGLFLLSWQFGPFVSLCQLFALVALGRLQFIPGNKVTALVYVIGASVILSCIVQVNPPLVVSSPALSMLLPAIILSATSPPDKRLGAIARIFVAAAELALMLISTILINGCIKIFLNIDADSHIYQLLLAKLQMGDQKDFDARLYVCNEAFQYLDLETMWRLTRSGLILVYGVGILVFMLSLAVDFFKRLPDKEVDDVDSYDAVPVPEEETSSFSEVEISEQQIKSDSFQSSKINEANAVSHHSCSQEVIQDDQAEIFPAEAVPNKSASTETDINQTMTHNRPDLVFMLALSLMWSILAGLILRLKVLWLPTICIISGVFMNDCRLYCSLFSKCQKVLSYFPRWFPGFFKVIVALSFVAYIAQKYFIQISSELWPEEMYEFWDPDTVDLMEWIQQHTLPDAVFAGSMQLLAGVKLCTGRHITNHPHYEDSWLRHRTHEIYQIYGRESPETVHRILRNAEVTHIILEDSICLAPSDLKHPLCRLNDIIDLHNGHVPVDGGHGISGLKQPQYARFCDAIRFDLEAYKQFFSLVMSNKTFRVYRVAVT